MNGVIDGVECCSSVISFVSMVFVVAMVTVATVVISLECGADLSMCLVCHHSCDRFR